MLRVRPIHFTSRLDEWERLLTGLGMVKTVDEPTWREFDAGSGRLALHVAEQGSAEDGTTSLGVEVGDLKEFARRTKEAGAADCTTSGGTTAELIEADHGPSCRITAADGFSFLADPATRAGDGSWGGSPEADPGARRRRRLVLRRRRRRGANPAQHRRPAPPGPGQRRSAADDRHGHGRIGSLHGEKRRDPDGRRRNRGRQRRPGLRIRRRPCRPASAPRGGRTRGGGHRGSLRSPPFTWPTPMRAVPPPGRRSGYPGHRLRVRMRRGSPPPEVSPPAPRCTGG